MRKLSKPAEPWRPRADHQELGDISDPLVAAEAARRARAAEWRASDSTAQEAERPWEQRPSGADLPVFGVEELERACVRFKRKTGLGVDNLHPRSSLLLPAEGKRAVAQVLRNVEETGVWPERQQCILYFLLLKANGKDRPIGLLPSLIRIWEAIRAPELWKWEKDHEEDWNWCAEGRAAEDAAWEALLMMEGGQLHSDEATVTIVMDLVKAFERVTLQAVWQWGLTSVSQNGCCTLSSPASAS